MKKMSYEYILLGDPVPKKSVRKMHGVFYNPQKQLMEDKRRELLAQHDGIRMYEGPIRLETTFCFQFPASISKKKRLTKSYWPQSVRPDIDNLLKLLLDVATGILWSDDCIITSVFANKQYADEPKTIFTVTEL